MTDNKTAYAAQKPLTLAAARKLRCGDFVEVKFKDAPNEIRLVVQVMESRYTSIRQDTSISFMSELGRTQELDARQCVRFVSHIEWPALALGPKKSTMSAALMVKPVSVIDAEHAKLKPLLELQASEAKRRTLEKVLVALKENSIDTSVLKIKVQAPIVKPTATKFLGRKGQRTRK